MARRRTVTTPAGGLLVLPAHLCAPRGVQESPGAYADRMRARAAWLAEHGVDPGDWPQVYAILQRSPGWSGALDRARTSRGTA
ncbi:hypothetical protein [Aquipuribacter sp. SD81]|uniref:hypothetical protein n=1 Tax=Aquipuribacter sp. SD81 TaxID=3127703 RepID=UPI00301A8F9E